jgi:hypothetical protein
MAIHISAGGLCVYISQAQNAPAAEAPKVSAEFSFDPRHLDPAVSRIIENYTEARGREAGSRIYDTECGSSHEGYRLTEIHPIQTQHRSGRSFPDAELSPAGLQESPARSQSVYEVAASSCRAHQLRDFDWILFPSVLAPEYGFDARVSTYCWQDRQL